MESKTTAEFWDLYYKLPKEVQVFAKSKYELWLADPGHRSLAFRTVRGHPNLWRVSLGDHYRAIALKVGDSYIWYWIGTHAEYDKLL